MTYLYPFRGRADAVTFLKALTKYQNKDLAFGTRVRVRQLRVLKN